MDKHFPFIDISSPTWLAYIALLIIAVYFRFTRFLTIRNFDLALLLLLSTAIVFSVTYRDVQYAIPVEAEAPVAAEETSNGTMTQQSVESAAAVRDSGEVKDLSPSNNPDTSADVADGADKPETGTEKHDIVYVVHPVYTWASWTLTALTLLLLSRLIFDESFTRRPRLEQNLNQAGLTFLCIPAFSILMVSVILFTPSNSTLKAVEHGQALLQRRDVPVDPHSGVGEEPAPTETLIAAAGGAVAQLSGSLPKSVAGDSVDIMIAETWLARTLVVILHTLVVLGLLIIGRQHFASWQLGVSMSCLYLLLPCTAVNVHELNHVLPAACLIWAIASYRNPAVAGILLGLAAGTLFFAAFLLPLWAVFYGRRGGLRFVCSVLGVAIVLVTTLLMISGDANSFSNKLVTTANWTVFRLLDDSTIATDTSISQLFIRIPMAAVFFVMLTAMTVLPRPRNLENLLSNSTCLVVAAQMWYPEDIGTYVLWYLPLFLIVVFRPRLDRFTPPDMVERQEVVVSSPTSAGTSSTVAMSRLSFFAGPRRSAGH